MPKIKDEDIEIIKQMIIEGYTYSEIGRKFNVTKNCIFTYAKKLSLNTGKRFKRKNSIIDNIFETIDTEEKAYWLGFIMADGGVCYTTNYYKESNKPNRLYINLSIKDYTMLEKFNKFLNYDKPIKTYIPKGTYSTNEMCNVTVNSVKLCKDLGCYGIVPNKTGKEYMPSLSSYLIRHFIRGFFDGDGSVYNSAGKTYVSFTNGNLLFLEQLKKELAKNEICIKNKISKVKNKEAYEFKFTSKKDIENFFNYIYKDSTIFMERKYNKFGNTLC